MSAFDKVYRTSLFRNGKRRRECWGATSADKRYEIERIEDTGTPWDVYFVPEDGKIERLGMRTTLAKAIELANQHQASVAIS